MSESPQKQASIRISKKTYRKNVAKQIARWLGYSVALIITVYLCFAATLIRIIPAYNSIGPVFTKNAPFSSDAAPAGAIVIANKTDEEGRDTISRLRETIVPSRNVIKVKIIAGPYGKLAIDKAHKKVTIDDTSYSIVLSNSPNQAFLNHDYLVECLDGACQKGTGLIIPEKNFYGVPLFKK